MILAGGGLTGQVKRNRLNSVLIWHQRSENEMDTVKRYHPISYLKTYTAEVARQLAEETDALIITQNGVPAFVCVSIGPSLPSACA